MVCLKKTTADASWMLVSIMVQRGAVQCSAVQFCLTQLQIVARKHKEDNSSTLCAWDASDWLVQLPMHLSDLDSICRSAARYSARTA